MKNKVLVGLSMGALLFGMITIANANLITNGSFEYGSFQADSNDTMSLSPGSTQLNGWSVINGELVWIGPSDTWSLDASDGSYFLDLTGYSNSIPYGGVMQSISTVIGQTYELSFDLGSSSLWGLPSSILASAGSVTATFTSADTGGNSDWEHFVLPFTAASTLTTISFVGSGSDVSYIGLDNVSLTTESAPIPEPASLLLIGTGIAGLVSIRLRRKLSSQG